MLALIQEHIVAILLAAGWAVTAFSRWRQGGWQRDLSLAMEAMKDRERLFVEVQSLRNEVKMLTDQVTRLTRTLIHHDIDPETGAKLSDITTPPA